MRHVRAPVLFLFAAAFAAAAWSSTLPRLGAGSDALAPYTGQGKWVVVKIWRSGCGICNAEAYQYVDFHEFHHDEDAVVLGISIDGDDEAAAQAFIERHALNYPNLITGRARGAALYTELTGKPWVGTPSFLLYDPSGRLRGSRTGAVPIEVLERFIETDGVR